jgi:mono/diheme cytochrome c family protein
MYFLLRLWLGLLALALFLLMLITSSATSSTNTSRITSKNTSRITSGNTSKTVERGRYLVVVGGCNDCHTMGYGETGGTVPESEWLVGGPMGFSGPWGTSYPINLRNMVDRMEEAEWVEQVKTAQALPPMPWFNLHAMTREDLSAMYAFIKHLGPKGDDAPAPLSPGVTPTTPYIEFVPKFPQGGTK